MQCRQLSYVAEFTTDIPHVPAVDNLVAGPDSCNSALYTGPGSCQPALHAGPDSCQPALHAGQDSCQPALHAGQDSCQPALHAGQDSCQPALHVAVVSPSLELLDNVSIAKNQLTCPSTVKAQTSLRLMHVDLRKHFYAKQPLPNPLFCSSSI